MALGGLFCLGTTGRYGVYMMFVYTVVYFDIEQIEPPMVGRQSPSFKGSFSRSAWLMWLSHLLQPCDAAWSKRGE